MRKTRDASSGLDALREAMAVRLGRRRNDGATPGERVDAPPDPRRIPAEPSLTRLLETGVEHEIVDTLPVKHLEAARERLVVSREQAICRGRLLARRRSETRARPFG